ncbi:MAG: hypothetical protein JXB10_12210 [Pirellulales bacterium]|nr:hypothetical protein [Pirellulales bacterium]
MKMPKLSLPTVSLPLAVLLGVCFAAGICRETSAAELPDELARSFANPPDSAKPHTWWHWMNGNITKEGITADLESMKRVGIAGVQIFNVLESIPDGPVDYLSPQWLELFRHAASEADRLGLELCFHNGAGWSNSGGPWIRPEHAMQKIVMSETAVKGKTAFRAALPQPPTSQNYYRDIAVFAFPTPTRKNPIDNLDAKILAYPQYHVYPYGLTVDAKEVPAAAVVPRKQIVDLTSRLAADGTLAWDVPEGEWTILRIGYTPTGKTNHPAPQSGTGLECDKLSREALDAHWAGSIEPILKAVGPLAGKTVNNCLIDSYEVGGTNWSPRFREEFKKRRGYDPVPMLPAVGGHYIESGEVTERFLWDLRRTVADLFAENYYDYFAELCHKHGLKFSAEPYYGPYENLQAGAKADVVMGEFWAGNDPGLERISRSVKVAASIGHTHGIRLIGAESFTSIPDDAGKWLAHPGSLKMRGDWAWCMGINRFILSIYAHQPWLDKAPGMTLGQWGTHFGRCNTWWEQSKPWMAYIARGQYLLQQGRSAADVLFFVGEAAPSDDVYRPDLKAKGYDYDTIGTDLIASLTVKDGRIVTPAGGEYRVLALPDTPWMTPALAHKVRDLVEAGAVVLAPKPVKSPSLTDYPACDAEVSRIAEEVWGKNPGQHAFGKGKIISGQSVEEVLASLGVKPDCQSLHDGTQPAFIHRVKGAADIYFISHQQPLPETLECALRVTGRLPELWDAETGAIEPAPLWRVTDGRTIVTLTLEQAGSLFVVFRQPAAAPSDPVVKITGPAGGRPGLEIRRAVYGDFSRPDGGKVEVTAKVRELVKNGQLQVKASNDLAGDPAFGRVKELRVDYALEGMNRSAACQEGQELFLPDCTAIQPALRLFKEDGRLRLLAPQSGRYVLTAASGAEKSATLENLPEPIELTGPWDLAFPPGRGAPDRAAFDHLVSWPDRSEPGIKYFSGTATYRKKITIPAACFGDNRRLQLDLGSVKEIAEVRLNGCDLGVLWKAPFRVDLTRAARPGENDLEVRVTNLWPNRLIGDEQEPDDCQWNGDCLVKWPDWLLRGQSRPVAARKTFTTWKHWHKDSPLQPSGLLGPVLLRTLEKISIED